MILAQLLLSLALSAPAAALVSACKPQVIVKKAALTLPGGESIKVDVVDTPATRETGLMCVTKMPRNYGMIFVFSREMELNFWMKNTLVPLDILWIGADKTITVIHERLKASRVDTPDSEIASAGGRGQYVLELAAGEAKRRGLKAGDHLKFSVSIPEK